jgi:hypothetical protein
MAYVATGYVAAGYVSETAIPDGYPLPSDVRLGVTYGPSYEYTGTYVTANAGAISDAIIAAAQVSPIYSDIRKVNNLAVDGTGTEGDPWGPV